VRSVLNKGFRQVGRYSCRLIKCGVIYVRCPLCLGNGPGRSVEDTDFFLQNARCEPIMNIRTLDRYHQFKAAALTMFPGEPLPKLQGIIDSLTNSLSQYMDPTRKCWLCEDHRNVCPGCTGGRIPATMFMGCGVAIRCPACVDYDGAQKDVNLFMKFYWDESPTAVRAKQTQNQLIKASITSSFASMKAFFNAADGSDCKAGFDPRDSTTCT
jgi:hypothetical protein